jgi:hypothetical protein
MKGAAVKICIYFYMYIYIIYIYIILYYMDLPSGRGLAAALGPRNQPHFGKCVGLHYIHKERLEEPYHRIRDKVYCILKLVRSFKRINWKMR